MDGRLFFRVAGGGQIWRRFIAISRSALRLVDAFFVRVRQASSPHCTSSRQCRLFLMCQCARARSSSCWLTAAWRHHETAQVVAPFHAAGLGRGGLTRTFHHQHTGKAFPLPAHSQRIRLPAEPQTPQLNTPMFLVHTLGMGGWLAATA